MTIPGSAVPLLLAQSAAEDSDYRVKRSTRFDGDSSYLNWTPTAEGDRRKWTFSCWVKKGSENTPQTLFSVTGGHFIRFQNDELHVFDQTSKNKLARRKHRDPSAWHHITVAVDYDNNTAANRVKGFIDGQQVAWEQVDDTYGQSDGKINQALEHFIGQGSSDDNYFDGQMADVYFIDAQALDSSSFGETNADTGQWVPKEYSGSYGTNGFHLKMDPANSGVTYSSGLLGYNSTHGQQFQSGAEATKAFNGIIGSAWNEGAAPLGSGTSTYIRFTPPSRIPAGSVKVHIQKDMDVNFYTGTPGSSTHVAGPFSTDTAAYFTLVDCGSVGAWDYMQMDVDTSGSGAYFGGIEVAGNLLADYTTIGYDSSGNKNHWHGNNLFAHEGTVGHNNFKAVTYDGLGTGNPKTIVLGFQPDLVWSKSTSHGDPHSLSDSVRGVSKSICSSSDDEETSTAGSYVTAFNSDGYTLGNSADVNGSSTQYVGWAWKAGGAASGNTDGTITSSVSANTAAGFSIVKYEGNGSASQTVGHGLGAKPDLILCKTLESEVQWVVYHSALGEDKYLGLDKTDDAQDASNYWGDGTISNTVFGLQAASGGNNKSGEDLIAYCWTEKESVSKFGSYTGNNSNTGPIIDCGFTPAFVLIKRTDTTSNWQIFDKARSLTKDLKPNTAEAQGTSGMSFIANGFQPVSTYTDINADGGTYVYMAIAGSPDGDLDLVADAPGAPYDNQLNGGGNYCTLNPLDTTLGTAINDGNLNTGASGAAGWEIVRGTIGVSSGKWYWEGVKGGTTVNSSNGYQFGLMLTSLPINGGPYQTGCYSVQGDNFYRKPAADVTGLDNDEHKHHAFALDLDAGTIKFYSDGELIHTETGIPAGTYAPFGGSYGGPDVTFNFGQRAFKYPPPDGYKALNTYNLSDPTITKGNVGFDARIYPGTGSAHAAVTDLEFSPDLVWTKQRDGSGFHALFDRIRGVHNALRTHSTGGTYTDNGLLTSFDDNGFSVGTAGDINNNNSGYVALNWDAGSSNSNTSVSAGGLNSSLYNQSETWSDNLSLSAGSWGGGQGPEKAFNGVAGASTNMAQRGDAAGGTITWTFSGLSGSCRVWIGNAGGTATDGNGTARGNNVGNGGTWVTLSGDISDYNGSIVISVSSDAPSLGAVEVAGKMLVDDDQTPPNVPTLASEYRVNTDTGFSIVEWTGSTSNETVAHGMNAKPDFMICKKTSADGNSWVVWHKDIGATKYLIFNSTGAQDTDATLFNSHTNDDSNVFSLGTNNSISDASQTAIAYLWSGVEGYSKFGSWYSTGDSFVYCGFKPKFLIGKCSSNNGDWVIYDTERDPFNRDDDNNTLVVQETDGEGDYFTDSQTSVDLLSNGFKIRHSGSAPLGDSTKTYIFAAWSESPFKYANAR